MAADIEAGPVVRLDGRDLPRCFHRHRHFRRYGRSSSQPHGCDEKNPDPRHRAPARMKWAMMKRQIGICEGVRIGPRRIKSTVTDVQPTMPIINRANSRGGARCPRPKVRFMVRRNRQKHRHGGRPRPLDSSPLSPQRKTAPRARPARRKMTSSRQVSWLAGHDPSPPSQALMHKAQWQPEEGLAADSWGAAPDLTRHRNGGSHRIPFWPINATGAPEHHRWKKPAPFLSTPDIHFLVRCDIYVSIV